MIHAGLDVIREINDDASFDWAGCRLPFCMTALLML